MSHESGLQRCLVCGVPVHIGCEHHSVEQAAPEISRERLADMLDLKIKVETDLSDVLEQVKTEIGVPLEARPEGFHLTVIGPTEYKVLKELDEATIRELQKINEQVARGEGIHVRGIGYIDGSADTFKMRSADTTKKTAFISFDIPALQEFRANVGLPPKDFHVTLGFQGGDIHTHIIGQEPVKPGSPKMKDVTAPIPKRPDIRFDGIAIPDMDFGGLSGTEKERKSL